MVRIARERISSLFALAEREAATGHAELADRYVSLARRIGMRYNIRLLPEYRELYCRGCSAFWMEGRTVRTRMRSGVRTRTCLKCGRARRTRTHGRAPRRDSGAVPVLPDAPRDEAALVSELLGEEESESPEDESEEE
jgi:ribonuclease P protein subunit RPR2